MNQNEIEAFFDQQYIDWDYIHKNCDLNLVRDKLFLYSRWFSIRFEHVINMMEDGYFFESLFNLITLLENYINSTNYQDKKLFDIIENNIEQEPDKSILHELRKIRNAMAHAQVIEFYVMFDNDKTEYPLNEFTNYATILNNVFIFCASYFDETNCKNKYQRINGICLKKYSYDEILKQYGFSKSDIALKLKDLKLNNSNEKEIKANIMRLLENSTPVSIWENIFKNLVNEEK